MQNRPPATITDSSCFAVESHLLARVMAHRTALPVGHAWFLFESQASADAWLRFGGVDADAGNAILASGSEPLCISKTCLGLTAKAPAGGRATGVCIELQGGARLAIQEGFNGSHFSGYLTSAPTMTVVGAEAH